MSTMEIATLKDVMTLGDVLAKSGFFQDARGAAQAVVKVLAGRELGFGPIASMTGVHIVKGKPVMSAMLIAAAIKRSGKYDYKVREFTNAVCKLEFFERAYDHSPKTEGAWTTLGESTFSVDDAKTAGLAGDNWRHFPRNMLFARAVSNGAKWYTPDIFGGPVYTPDELGIDVDGETGEVKNLSSVTVEESAAGPLDPERNDRKAPGRSTAEVGSPGLLSAGSETAGVAPSPAASSNPEDHREESETLFPSPEEQERQALIKRVQIAGAKLTKTQRGLLKQTFLGDAEADITKADIAALNALAGHLEATAAK